MVVHNYSDIITIEDVEEKIKKDIIYSFSVKVNNIQEVVMESQEQ